MASAMDSRLAYARLSAGRYGKPPTHSYQRLQQLLHHVLGQTTIAMFIRHLIHGVDDRRVLSGIVHALRNGGRWADCPREVYGPKKTLYNRFVRWAERGIWERIFSALAGGEDAPDRLFIDSTCIKVHRCAGGGKGGGLGPWHRPHQGGPQHQAPRCLRCERQAPRPAPDTRKRP